MNKKIGKNFKNPIFGLIGIGFVGLLIRLYYFPYEIPIILDGYLYFLYAIDMSILGTFPTNYTFPNNGWPALLSILFTVFHFENFLDYMTLQRVFSVVISVLTIIPVYLLCRHFFEKRYALLGSALFILDPRIIQNSLLGITDPLFIILISLSLVLFLSKNERKVVFAFGVAALASIVRYEGLLIMIPYSIMFFIRFRTNQKSVIKYLICIAIFILIISPMAYIRIQITGKDGFLSHVAAGPQHVINRYTIYHEDALDLLNFAIHGVFNTVKYLGWITIPIFIFFVFFGTWYLIKKRDFKKNTLILTFGFLVLPAYYAYARNIEEPRYLLVTIPILCVVSLFAIKKLNEKLNKHNFVLILLIIGIIVGSLLFLELKKDDLEHSREAYLLTTKIGFPIIGINEFYPESEFLRLMPLYDHSFQNLENAITGQPKLIASSNFNNIEDYILYGKDHGLTHIATDGKFDNSRGAMFLNDIFVHEDKYPYLIKQFDSKKFDSHYQLKIFKIDYQKFNSSHRESQ